PVAPAFPCTTLFRSSRASGEASGPGCLFGPLFDRAERGVDVAAIVVGTIGDARGDVAECFGPGCALVPGAFGDGAPSVRGRDVVLPPCPCHRQRACFDRDIECEPLPGGSVGDGRDGAPASPTVLVAAFESGADGRAHRAVQDRKSTRLNSSHVSISY